MRCDLSTCSSAHISLLVSGSAQTCFNDQILENHIKNELTENSQLVHVLPSSEESKLTSSDPRKSASVTCGASVFEVAMKVPTWASRVLRQLAPDVSLRSLVMLGIASIQGLSAASFEKDDADRLLFFCMKQRKGPRVNNLVLIRPPSWLVPPAPCQKQSEACQDSKSLTSNDCDRESGITIKRRVNIAAMRPIPLTRQTKMQPFSGFSESERLDGDQAQQIISLNPLPLKKHGCGRSPIQICSEEEFLRDVMQFLILRGHSSLVPQGGLAEFPASVLNAKRLDLFNLYSEVVSRGSFHVGNGINWKGQVFSKMRNHTLTNRMTGVGNSLKRHYETYLLEYELAHDDVHGECCLLCHSSAAGDWVNCGICSEWAHFGCDQRQGLGAFMFAFVKLCSDVNCCCRNLSDDGPGSYMKQTFSYFLEVQKSYYMIGPQHIADLLVGNYVLQTQDYAKTDGLEYICPHCSITKLKKKSQKTANGYLTNLDLNLDSPDLTRF